MSGKAPWSTDECLESKYSKCSQTAKYYIRTVWFKPYRYFFNFQSLFFLDASIGRAIKTSLSIFLPCKKTSFMSVGFNNQFRLGMIARIQKIVIFFIKQNFYIYSITRSLNMVSKRYCRWLVGKCHRKYWRWLVGKYHRNLSVLINFSR